MVALVCALNRLPHFSNRRVLLFNNLFFMSSLDWIVLIFTITGIVGYGIHKGHGQKDIEEFLLTGKKVALSTIMANDNPK